MSRTYRVVLHSPRKDGTQQVRVRVVEDRAVSYIGLPAYVKAAAFNKNAERGKRNWIRTNHPDAEIFNRLIAEKLRELDDPASVQHGRTLVLEFLDGEVARRKEQGKTARQWEKLPSLGAKLREFGGDALTWADLTVAHLERFEAWMLHTKKLKRNSASKHLSELRALVRRAVRMDVIPDSLDPFRKFQIRLERPGRDKLSMEEVVAIASLEVEGLLALARDTFMLQFYCAGMRVSDVMQLKVEDVEHGILSYRMDKTGKVHSLRLPQQAEAIFGRYAAGRRKGYLLPYLSDEVDYDRDRLVQTIESRTATYNLRLKRLAAMAGIEKNVSSHIARHSFASISAEATGDVYAISKALGHASVQVTQNYLKQFDRQAVDGLLDRVFNK